MSEPTSLLSVCCGNAVQIWDLDGLSRAANTPICIQLPGGCTSSCWNSMGKAIASVGEWGGVHLATFQGANILSIPCYPGSASSCISFSKGNKYVAIGYNDGRLPVWDVKGKTVFRDLSGHRAGVTAVQYSPNEGHCIASSSMSGDVLLHSAKEGKQLSNLSLTNLSPKLDLCFSQLDPSLLVSAGKDGNICLFDIVPRILKSKLAAHKGAISSLCFNEGVSKIVYSVGREDQKLVQTDLRVRESTVLASLGFEATCITARNDGVWLAVGSADGTLQLYDTRSMESPVHVCSTGTRGAAIRSLSFQPCQRIHLTQPLSDAVPTGTVSKPRNTTAAAASGEGQPGFAGISPFGAGMSAFTPLAKGRGSQAAGGLSPCGLSSFTPLPTAGQTCGSTSGMPSTRHQARVPVNETNNERNQEAAREAKSLYDGNTLKPPSNVATLEPRQAKTGCETSALQQAQASVQQQPVALGAFAPAADTTDGTSPETPKMFQQLAEESDNKENRDLHNFSSPKERRITYSAVKPMGPPAAPLTVTRTAPATARRLAGTSHVSESAAISTLQNLVDDKVEGVRDDVRNLHIDLLHQFHVHQAEMLQAFQVIASRQEVLQNEVLQLRQQVQQANRREAENSWM